MRDFANNIVTGVLLVCAVGMTILAWRDRQVTQIREEPRQVADWEEVASAGIRVGPPDAPVQIVEFVDLQCPFCARFHTDVESVLEEHDGAVAWTFVHYPLSIHDQALQAALAAECAADQGRLLAFVDRAFELQETFAEEPWSRLADGVGVGDMPAFERCMEAGVASRPRIAAGKAAGEKIRISGTPAVVINGWLQPHVPYENLDSIVTSILEEGR